MASPVKLYQHEMHKNIGFFATWLPGDTINVGDVGIHENGRFRLLTSLAQLGIHCDINKGKTTKDLQYTSTEGINITSSASAAMPVGAKGEIAIEFSRDGAFVFNASGLTKLQIENRAYVAEQVVKAYSENKWEEKWLLVESVYAAKRTTVIISQGGSAGLTLQASAEVVTPAASLADPKVSLNATSSHGEIFQLVGGKNLYPLYSCLRIKDSWFIRKPTLSPVRGNNSTGATPFERVSIDDLLNS